MVLPSNRGIVSPSNAGCTTLNLLVSYFATLNSTTLDLSLTWILGPFIHNMEDVQRFIKMYLDLFL